MLTSRVGKRWRRAIIAGVCLFVVLLERGGRARTGVGRRSDPR